MVAGADDRKLLADFSTSDETRLFEEAFKDPEVVAAIHADLVGYAQLETALSQRLPAIHEASAERRAQLAESQKQLRELLYESPPGRGAIGAAARFAYWSVVIAFGAAVATFCILGFAHGWRALLHSDAIAWIGRIAPFVTPLVVVSFLLHWLLRRRFNRIRSDWWTAREVPLAKARESVIVARTAFEEHFLRSGLVPELRELIGVFAQANYSVTLPTLRAIGLGEVFDPAFEIQTDAKARIARILSSIRGGSIGISGPRGAGKSTLVRYFCGGLTRLRERDVLALLVSAPVGYQARDFILHLFASLCRRILEKKGVTDHETPPRVPRPLEGVGRRIVTRAALIAQIAGILMIAIALSLAWARSSIPKPKDGEPPSFAAALLSDFAPTGLLTWGVGLLVGAAVYVMRTFMKRNLNPRVRREEITARRAETMRLEVEARDPLARETLRWLSRIRFQQSFSSGWSGTLSMPIGASTGLTSAESFAQNQLSLPEIVNGFRDLVATATREYEVIIGIDELDKLETDEKAFQFLNDVKAVFGIEHAFYLLSVSENAMSNFERRGLPIRDAFDSAFDAIVHVEFLGVEETSRLLNRRVVGLPLPFHCLCHALSGGLPRDLIRVAREVIYAGERIGDGTPIGTITNDLIRTELRAKTTAVSIAARRLPLAESVSAFQTRLRDLEHAENVSLVGLQLHVEALIQFAHKLADPASDTLRSARDALVALAYELAAFTLCLAITGAVFADPDPHALAKEATLLAELRQALGVYPRYAYDLARQHPLFVELTAPRSERSAR